MGQEQYRGAGDHPLAEHLMSEEVWRPPHSSRGSPEARPLSDTGHFAYQITRSEASVENWAELTDQDRFQEKGGLIFFP